MSRTQWFCVVICHVLDRKVEGSNLAAAKNLCQFESTKISSQKSEQKNYIGKDQRKGEREREGFGYGYSYCYSQSTQHILYSGTLHLVDSGCQRLPKKVEFSLPKCRRIGTIIRSRFIYVTNLFSQDRKF